MKKNQISKIIVFFLLPLVGCSPTRLPINIKNINDAQGIRKYSTIYTLPKTAIRVNVKVERTSFKKGPYHQYAASLLGLTNIIQEDSHNWKIADIDFVSYPVADTNHTYLVESVNESNIGQLVLSKEGFLQAFSPDIRLVTSEFHLLNQTDDLQKIHFFNSPNTPDPQINFDNIPLPKELYTKKTPGEEASFLSSKILTLRDDKAAILVGDGYTEIIPEGEALKTMLYSIDSLNQKYLLMFAGQSLKETFYYSFDYIPGESRKKTQYILFRFSEQFGIVENNDVNGMPMIIELESYENLKIYEQFSKKQGVLIKLANKKGKEIENEKGLFYRIPEYVSVRIIQNDKVLKQQEMQIPQFGSIHSLPIGYLNGNFCIEFYPGLGSIKSIIEKNNIQVEKKK